MIHTINTLKKMKVAALGVVSSLVLISCGSYQTAGYDNDGVYGSNSQRVAARTNNNTVTNSDSYFTQKLQEYENAASSDEVLTDIEGYSTQNYDNSQAQYESDNYQGWGENAQQNNVQVYANVGWGYNNYNPYWNRGYRNYNRFWGASPYYNSYYGWNNPFYGGFYGGGYYGSYWGNRLWYGNGFYNYGYNSRYYGYGGRRYVGNRRSVRSTANRNYAPRYSGNRSSARSSSGRSTRASNPRTYSSRQSTSTRSGRSSSSSNRTYSPRSSSSSSNRSYSPRSSSSSSNRSSTRSGRSSSSSRSSGTYRRR